MFHYIMNQALYMEGYLPTSLFVSIVSNTYHEIILFEMQCVFACFL